MTIGVADGKELMPLTDLVLAPPETSQSATSPAAVYLSGLARTGRRAMAGQLRWVAGVAGRRALKRCLFIR